MCDSAIVRANKNMKCAFAKEPKFFVREHLYRRESNLLLQLGVINIRKFDKCILKFVLAKLPHF